MMTEPTPAPSSNDCVACREPLRAGARLCPQCHSPQRGLFWHHLSTSLKWVGGIVTVVSLVVGMLTLTGYFQDWRERRQAVNELVAAADWLIRTDNYRQAWQMYDKALDLSPGSPGIFAGQLALAQRWLRDFNAPAEQAAGLLDRLTEVLYRGLTRADPPEQATLLAHIAWARGKSPVFSAGRHEEVMAIFDQALAAQPTNVYANAMSGAWLLFRRGVGVDEVEEATARFDLALAGELARPYVRRLQFNALVNLSYGKSDALERAALAALLPALWQRLQQGEEKPTMDHRFKILSAYGTSGRGDHIEASVAMLPPNEHLAVIDWLLQDLDYYRGNQRMRAQLAFLRARLREAAGERTVALERYRQLMENDKATAQLNKLIDQGIGRLTGALPARATARRYIDDAIGEQDPWTFHLDTLAHFDAMWQPRNFDQALTYIGDLLGSQDPRLATLVTPLAQTRTRVRQLVRRGDEIARNNSYTSGFSRGHHDSARYNLVRLGLVSGELLIALGQYDPAIAELGDVAKLLSRLDDDWAPLAARTAYQLARGYALRAAKNQSAEDRRLALSQLRRAVDGDAVDGERIRWTDIKGKSFASLRHEADYQALIRGR